MSSQNNYSFEMEIKAEDSKDIYFKEVSVSGDYRTIFKSNYKLTNNLKFSTLNVSYWNDNFGKNNITKYNEIENTFTLGYIFKKTTFNIEIKPIANYEQNLNANDITFYGGFTMDFKINLKNKIQFGVNKTNVFGKPEILPTFSFERTFNKKWILNIGFPESNISYFKNNLTTIVIKNLFNGNYYNLDNPIITSTSYATKASYSQMTTTLQYERNMDTYWFLNFKAGYDFYRSYSLLNNQNKSTFDYNINNGYNFSITIKFKQ